MQSQGLLRATRDVDLLPYGASDLASVADAFPDISALTSDDRIVFDPASVVGQSRHARA